MNKPNPAWNGLLSKIPAEFHEKLYEDLAQWDNNFKQVQDQASLLRPYLQLAEQGIQPNYINQAVQFAQHAQNNPAEIVKRLNEVNNLGLMTQAEFEASQADNSEYEFDGTNLEQHPKFKALASQLEQMGQQFTQTQAQQQEQQQIQEFESYLDDLESQYKNQPFNRKFVTALLMADDSMTGEDAVKQFHDVIAKAVPAPNSNDTQQPNRPQMPTILGNGSSGSGVPNNEIDVTALKSDDLDSLVGNLLNKFQQQ